MKKVGLAAILVSLTLNCTRSEKSHQYTAVQVTDLYKDSISIRAIEFLDDHTLAFAGSKGVFGTIAVNSGEIRTNQMTYDTLTPEFRAVGHTRNDFFMMSIGSPALIYKTGDNGQMELVYKEEGAGVFYDAMKFWNQKEGIALGDGKGDCLSLLITRDGGHNWHRVPCSQLPEALGDEGAFAASNTNIAMVGGDTWIATTASRVYFSPDKGGSWALQQVPIVNQKPTQGIYSIDFYSNDLGIAFGGDYTEPGNSKNNKAMTRDGGKSWSTVAQGEPPGYKSCVQFVPHAGGEDIVAVGFTGITYSSDGGTTWQELSKESFYTLKFLNDSTAYAAGKGRVSRLDFK